MKRVIYILTAVCLMVVLATGVAEAKKNKKDGQAKISFAEMVYDFGTIKEDGGPVSHDFQFTNTGDGNLVIFDAKAECGCTRPSFPDNAIAPGKSNKVKVTYNPLGRPGGFDKVVTITTNGNPRKVRLKVRGTVTPK